MMQTIRSAAVAGYFYPSDPGRLQQTLSGLLRAAPETGPLAKALIAPHAGYVYSGAVAATAYANLARRRITRVVMIGPSHRIPFAGLALPGADAFETPLGRVEVDAAAVARIAALPQVVTLPEAHAMEHSLEVQLPFLQQLLGDFKLLPLVAGRAPPAAVAEVLEQLWGGEETVIVISSDLSHYHDYQSAREIDAATTEAIETLRFEAIGPEQACGCVGVNGLLSLARSRGLTARTLSVANSGDTAGPRDRVVGYGAYAVG
jgi:AmmeMemoRadiSam system protein B